MPKREPRHGRGGFAPPCRLPAPLFAQGFPGIFTDQVFVLFLGCHVGMVLPLVYDIVCHLGKEGCAYRKIAVSCLP